MKLNLGASYDLSNSFFKSLKKSKIGSIVNIASIYGIVAPDYKLYKKTNMQNPAAYGASKAGLIQLTKWQASTFAPYVRVNCISLGGIFNNQNKIFLNKYKNKTLLGRMGIKSDINGTITYLTTDLSSYVTGQNIVVDGGFTAR